MEMDVPPIDSQTKMNQPPSRKKGGLKTMPFIIVNEAFEKVASYGLVPNMILYLISDYKVGVAKGTNILFLWSAATNFLPLVGGFISDSYLGRFRTIVLGSLSSLLGMILLWLTTMLPKLKPPLCDQFTQSCQSATHAQYTFLIFSLAFISIGSGGVRPCSIAFGADQIDNRDNPKNKRAMERYFGLYYASALAAILIALIGIVYIQDRVGWKVGFGVPAVLMFLSTLSFFVASPLYIKRKVERSLLSSFSQVVVVAYKNRKLACPLQHSDGWYHHKDTKFSTPTKRLRFLNKACIVRNPKDLSSDGVALDPWSLCTVEQVEELKALIRVIPLWSSCIMMTINFGQTTFPVLQASTMDRHLTSSFQIPAGSFYSFMLMSLILWVILYDRVIIPIASKIKGKPVHIHVKYRMGIGLVLSCLAMVVSALVEHTRRRKAIHQGFLNNPSAVVAMSAFWVVPQHCLNGLADALNGIGQTEFYYSEFPKSLSSIASSLSLLGVAMGNLLASVIVSIVDKVTKGRGRESWVSNNINKGRFDNYYWLLAIMSFINLFYYLACIWLYGPSVDEMVKYDQSKDSGEKSHRLEDGVGDC